MGRASATEIAESLRQTSSAGNRISAIISLGKALRRKNYFHPLWAAVGGAAGLAALMAEFSVYDVQMLCKKLGRTSSTINVRAERRAALGELVRLLFEQPQDNRPLRKFYQDIVPACELEVVREWEEKGVEWTPFQQKAVALGHRGRYEEKFLAEIFTPDAVDTKFKNERKLFGGNLLLCEKVLEKLLAIEGDVVIPNDFFDEFAMPLLKRLAKKRADIETRVKFLDYVIRSIQKFPDQLVSQLHVGQGGLIQYTIHRWNEAPAESKEQLKDYLVVLLELYPAEKRRLDLADLHRLISIIKSPEARYELLRLVFRHIKTYGIDIDDGSDQGLARLRSLPVEGDLWPAKLFFSIDVENARRLFERLAEAHPSGDFIASVTGSYERTVLKQTRIPSGSRHADPEIIRSLLAKKSQVAFGEAAWRDRARELVKERRKKALQAREAIDRAFWAKSALRLCVAAGDLESLGSAVIWARRFIKDSLASRELFGADILETAELQALLCAVPERDTPAAAAATASSVETDVGLANMILVNLVETATMAVQEPSFDSSSWRSLLQLPQAIADLRLKKSTTEFFHEMTKLEDRDEQLTEIARVLWKPTMDALIEVEALLYTPASKALVAASYGAVSGIYVLDKLLGVSSAMVAELARFVLERMKARLGPDRLRVQMGSVVHIVLRVARSDQPSLAIPFIRDLTLYGDDNSSWHRQLVNVGFLSSLPAKAAREFLEGMASAFRDKMREQNARPLAVDGKPQPSVIKVTTIKMMAQVLENNPFISVNLSCDILVSLLSEARHIDARITIVSSLISTMEVPNCPPELRARVLDALETYIVPATAQLSERRPLTEEDWATGLPDVGEETPLLDLLLKQSHNAKLNPDDKPRIAKLISHALEQSAVNNSRWIDLFLKKNNFTTGTGEPLPRWPVSPSVLERFATGWISYMPASLFEMLRDIVLFNLDPPPEIASATKAIKKNHDLVASNAGKHWLRQFDQPGAAAFGLGLQFAALQLQRPKEEVVPKQLGEGEGVTVRMMQDLVREAAARLISKGDFETLDDLINRLRQNRFHGRGEWESWRDNCVPLTRDIIAMVEDVRLRKEKKKKKTEGADAAGRPLDLPNKFQLSLAVLPIPCSSPKQPASAEDIDALVSELSAHIDRLATRRLPYHGDFTRLKDEVMRTPKKEDFTRVALRLGRLNDVMTAEEPSLADYLRLELVGDLLIKADHPADKTVVADVQDMVRDWMECQDETLRGMGVTFEDRLRWYKKPWAVLG
ncbi:uncharacterized protein CTRU02_206983 [Colletotrichum truncatum]|uniref:Uncharacterized protein n=1 Tax=Colletotrichum truncatum TaxID=5467 RepID=A0ACC3YZI3_COLTU|nr:uncharacterized protein CTRU02_11164 [Colletotrichum truncatum]KAF6786293.1 hypothetical protein CTRU02_11164 [Colletotrichum truncatum]